MSGLISNFPRRLANRGGASKVGCSQAGQGGQSFTVQDVISERVTFRQFGAVGDGGSHPLSERFDTLALAQAVYPHAIALTDEVDWCAIQACLNYCAPQYDPTQKMHDGNNFSRIGISKTIYAGSGTFVINRTLNASFRNMFGFEGESVWNTVIRWSGQDNGMMIDARCSNYVRWSNFTLDGAHKARTFLYQAGNGVNAPNSKGNVTGNYFGHIYFWNQIGFLTGEAPDFPDQYDPLSAMLCLTSIEGASYYNSMDDSMIEFCRFAPNSLNNNFGIAISSTTTPIDKCWFFCANSVLVSNGAAIWMTRSTSSNYAPRVDDGQHHHAVLKFAYNGMAYAYATMEDCYHESMDYYGNGNSSVLAFWAQGVEGPADNQAKVQQLVIRGGLYSCSKTNTAYIEFGSNRRANIVIDNAAFQGTNKGYIYAPDCSIEITHASNATSTGANNSAAWQPTAYKSLSMKYSTPDFQVCGERSSDVTVTIGAIDDPARLYFMGLDEALPFVCSSKAQVTIYMEKNDVITRPITLNSNIYLALGAYTLSITGKVKNFGSVSVTSNFENTTRAGGISSNANMLENFSTLIIKNTNVEKLATITEGRATFSNVDFQGVGDAVILGDAGEVVIDNDTCVYSATGYVVNLGKKLGKMAIRSSYGATPATGKWMRGTYLEFTNPLPGYAAQFWATADGIGAAAKWAKAGNMTAV